MLEQILQDDWVLALILAADAQMPNHHLDKGCALGEVGGVHCLSAPRTNGTVVDQSLLNAGMTHQLSCTGVSTTAWQMMQTTFASSTCEDVRRDGLTPLARETLATSDSASRVRDGGSPLCRPTNFCFLGRPPRSVVSKC